MDYHSISEKIRIYWNDHIHDLNMVRHPIGTKEFFDDLDEYRFDKNRYLLDVIDFSEYKSKQVLEVGCGVGIDLVRFARHGAIVYGIDLSQRAIDLAQKNFELHGLKAELMVMDGTNMKFENNRFDCIYAHGVLPYVADVPKLISEIHRVLKPHGVAILQAYSRYSWLNLFSILFRVKLEHQDSPVFQKHSISEFRKLLMKFTYVEIVPERFPVRSRLQRGVKAKIYNTFFVDAFNLIPKTLIRPFGWHLIAKAIK